MKEGKLCPYCKSTNTQWNTHFINQWQCFNCGSHFKDYIDNESEKSLRTPLPPHMLLDTQVSESGEITRLLLAVDATRCDLHIMHDGEKYIFTVAPKKRTQEELRKLRESYQPGDADKQSQRVLDSVKQFLLKEGSEE